MADVRRSLALAALQSYLSVALQLLSTAVLSRLLTPAEVGVFAVASVFAALATNFRDFGIGEYLIQAKSLTERDIRAALTVNIGTSWLMGLLMVGSAPWVGTFYRSEVIADVMRVQAMNFALIPFGAINLAWFRRQLDFRPLVISGLAAEVSSLVVAIGLALQGFGAMSLAWSSFAGIVVTVAVALYFRPKDFPRLPGLHGLREVLHFGSFASGIYVLGQLGRGAPEMIIGRVQGVTDVAIFSRAGGMVQLFRQLVTRAIMPVCLPYFAEAVRSEHNVSRAYVRGVAIFTAIGWTFLGFLALEALPAIRIIYGPQWDSAAPLARILCLVGAAELVHQLAKEALLSQGQVKLASRLQLLLVLVQVAGLAAVVPFGLQGACWGLLAAALLGLGLSQWHLHIGAGFRIADLWAACRTSLVVAALSLLPALLLAWLAPAGDANYVRHILVGGLLTAVAWLLALRLCRHPLWAEVQRAAAVVRAHLPRRASDPPAPL